jgi:ribosomal protein S18 acetylase RimI-like enzyme
MMSHTTVLVEVSSLAAAMEHNLHGHVSFVQRRLPEMFVDDREDLLLVDSGLPTDTFNKICRARLREEEADARIAAAIAYFRQAGRPFSWWVGPASRPLDLEERLARHGLRASEGELGMFMDMALLPPAPALEVGTDIRRVRTSQELLEFARIMAECFDPPDASVVEFFARAAAVVLRDDCPMQFFLAWVNGQAAAGSELFLDGGFAGVHMVATRREFQRRGLGFAMTWTALAAGRRLGARTAALQASDEGVRVYDKLGFGKCCRFVEYTPA